MLQPEAWHVFSRFILILHQSDRPLVLSKRTIRLVQSRRYGAKGTIFRIYSSCCVIFSCTLRSFGWISVCLETWSAFWISAQAVMRFSAPSQCLRSFFVDVAGSLHPQSSFGIKLDVSLKKHLFLAQVGKGTSPFFKTHVPFPRLRTALGVARGCVKLSCFQTQKCSRWPFTESNCWTMLNNAEQLL